VTIPGAALGRRRGSAAKDCAPCRPCDNCPVNATRRYIVLIARGPSGHIAFAPSLPDIIGRGRGRNSAYRDFRAKLHEHVAGLVDRGVPVPRDDIAAVKFVRVDLTGLEAETGLL
jgi:hypothetical protein